MAHTLANVPTPSLILDRTRLVANAHRMKRRAQELRVALRPHLKTAKAAEVARLALTGAGAAVSTLREAEYFAEHGVRDLVLAVCVTPQKLERALALSRKEVVLTLITDSVGRGARDRGS